MEDVISSGTTSSGIISDWGVEVLAGGTVIDTTVDDCGWLIIHEGGIASNTTVKSGGRLTVDPGGTATNIHWTPFEGDVIDHGAAKITFDATLSGVYYGSSGQLLSQAKTMTSKHLNYIGYDDETGEEITEKMCVMSGGTANKTIISGAHVDVWNGGVINSAILNGKRYRYYWDEGDEYSYAYGGLVIHNGGKASNVTINNRGYLTVYSGGKADGVRLNSGGECEIDGGTATIVQWTPCVGDLSLWDGGKAIFTSKYSGVYIGANDMLLSHTKTITSNILEAKDEMHVMSGGTANYTTLYGADATIWNGGRANHLTISGYEYFDDIDWDWYYDHGYLNVYSGGTANYTFLDLNGHMDVEFGGKAIETTIKGGHLQIYSGGIVSNTTIAQYYQEEEYDDGESWINAMRVSSGGAALTTIIGGGGYLYVSSGGIATNITLKTGGHLCVASGGMVGSITNLGGTLEAEDGAILNYVYKGGGSSSTTLTVSPDADIGGNNWMFDKKTGETNEEVTGSEPVKINSDIWEIQVDAGEIAHEDQNGKPYSNFVGYGDAVDFLRIDLEDAAKLSFTITATGAAKVTIWKLDEKWKKEILFYSQKSLQSTKLSLNKKTGVYSADTKTLLLKAGEYFISVESTNAKKGGNAYYNIELNHDKSVFFTKGDNSDDWTDMKENGDSSDEFGDAGTINKNTVSVIGNGWVGYNDSVDYMRIHLDETAKLSFLLDATDTTKFTICKLVEKVDKKGVVSYSLKSLQSTELKKPKGSDKYAATTKSILLKEGDYYIAMNSTNAKKGGNADYNVLVNGNGTAFFTDADNGWNNWVYDKKNKELNEEIVYGDSIMITPHTERVQVDSEALCHEDADGIIWDNYVGYGDEFDFAKIRLESDARLNITITATDAMKFTVYELLEKVDSWTGIVSYKLGEIQSSKLKKAKGDSLYRYSVTMMVPGNYSYLVSLQSTNAAKGGCAYYNVEINQKKSSFEDYYYGALSRPSEEEEKADALTMPETGGTEDRLFVGLDSDFMRDASLSAVDSGLDSVRDKLLGESGMGILASL